MNNEKELLPSETPSERIKQIINETLGSPPCRDANWNDWIIAIMDYLDEQAKQKLYVPTPKEIYDISLCKAQEVKKKERNIPCQSDWHKLTAENYCKIHGPLYPRSCPDCHSCFNPKPSPSIKPEISDSCEKEVEELAEILFDSEGYTLPKWKDTDHITRMPYKTKALWAIHNGYSKQTEIVPLNKLDFNHIWFQFNGGELPQYVDRVFDAICAKFGQRKISCEGILTAIEKINLTQEQRNQISKSIVDYLNC